MTLWSKIKSLFGSGKIDFQHTVKPTLAAVVDKEKNDNPVDIHEFALEALRMFVDAGLIKIDGFSNAPGSINLKYVHKTIRPLEEVAWATPDTISLFLKKGDATLNPQHVGELVANVFETLKIAQGGKHLSYTQPVQQYIYNEGAPGKQNELRSTQTYYLTLRQWFSENDQVLKNFFERTASFTDDKFHNPLIQTASKIEFVSLSPKVKFTLIIDSPELAHALINADARDCIKIQDANTFEVPNKESIVWGKEYIVQVSGPRGMNAFLDLTKDREQMAEAYKNRNSTPGNLGTGPAG